MDLNLNGKKGIVTGNSRGIGKAITECLRKEGVSVYDISRTSGYDLMTSDGFYKTSVHVKNVDILINNLGGIGSNEKEWELALEKNYNIMVKLTREFLSTKRNWGRVITISSIYGKEKGHNPGFAAAKAAQIAYMKSLAGRYEGTTFNIVCPGHIDVGKPFPDNPKVVGKPEDVAGIVTFLCSPLAHHINGAVITVDGGVSASF